MERTRREIYLGEGSGTGSGSQHLYVNMGPSHPAMHGVIRIVAELDGETVVKADVEIGYLHRASRRSARSARITTPFPSRTVSITCPL